MARKVFYSFHYEPDNWRASQVRQMGALEGNQPAKDNDWETVTKGGDAAIKKWIADQMNGRTCAIVLIGKNTAGRKWIKHEIEKSWNDGKGVLGIYVHHIKNVKEQQTTKGSNPFKDFTLNDGAVNMKNVVKAYDPPFTTSTKVYSHIKDNLSDWVEEAIEIRKNA